MHRRIPGRPVRPVGTGAANQRHAVPRRTGRGAGRRRPDAAERFRGALSEGEESHAIYPPLDYVAGEAVISKNRFGAFIGSGGKLEETLRAAAIDTLIIAGTVTNMCCETTAREACMLNFKTIMVSDGNAGRNDEEHNAALSAFLIGMGDVHSTDDLIVMLDSAAS